MGGVPFSPELKRHSTTIGIWDAVVKKKKGVKFSMSKLRRMELSAGITNSMHCSLEEAEDNLKESRQQYNQFKKRANSARKSFLEDLAQAVAVKEDRDKTSVYKQLIHREEQRAAGRKMRAALGKTIKGGIKRVEVISEDGSTKEIITKDGIEKVCLDENNRKYCQTQDTPCMSNPQTIIGPKQNWGGTCD